MILTHVPVRQVSWQDAYVAGESAAAIDTKNWSPCNLNGYRGSLEVGDAGLEPEGTSHSRQAMGGTCDLLLVGQTLGPVFTTTYISVTHVYPPETDIYRGLWVTMGSPSRATPEREAVSSATGFSEARWFCVKAPTVPGTGIGSLDFG